MPVKHPDRRYSLELIDTQAAGDVSRILLGGVAPLPGESVHEQQQYLEAHGDGLRRLLLSEPYGHPSQSVNLVVVPGDARAQAGYIIMEAMGYPIYSGSNTICTATALLQSGRVPIEEGEQTVRLESPAGRDNDDLRAASATYVHPHVICRSPTGTGTSARLALMAERGEIESNRRLETISPRNNCFTGTLLGETEVDGRRAWDTLITGRAWTLARSEIVVELNDPLVDNHDLAGMLSGRT